MSSAARKERDAGSRKSHGRQSRWLLPFALLAAAAGIVASVETANWQWFREALGRTLISLAETALAFVVFLLVFLLGNAAVALGFARWSESHRGRLVALVCAFLMVLLVVNSLPILVWVETMKSAELSAYTIRVLALLSANAMLYYFFSGFLFDAWRETEKLYVVSAPFKGTSALDYLKERATWSLLSNLSPLFYYLFSFTLFTDILLQGYHGGRQSGIVLVLFNLLTKDWSPAALWRATVYLLTLMALVLPVRFFLDELLFSWEKHRRVVYEAL